MTKLLIFISLLLFYISSYAQFYRQDLMLYFFSLPDYTPYIIHLLNNKKLRIKQIQIQSEWTVHKEKNKRINICITEDNIFSFYKNPLKLAKRYKHTNLFVFSDTNSNIILELGKNSNIKKILTNYYVIIFLYNNNNIKKIIFLKDSSSNYIIDDFTFQIKNFFINKRLYNQKISVLPRKILKLSIDTTNNDLKRIDYFNYFFLDKTLSSVSMIFTPNQTDDTIIKRYFYFPQGLSYSRYDALTDLEPKELFNSIKDSMTYVDTFLVKKRQDYLPKYIINSPDDTLLEFIYKKVEQGYLLNYIKKQNITDTIKYTNDFLLKSWTIHRTFNFKYRHKIRLKKYKPDSNFINWTSEYLTKLYIIEYFIPRLSLGIVKISETSNSH